MARVFGYLLALLFVSSVSAVPVKPRQTGGMGCNVARLKTVTGLRQTTNAVSKIASSGDPAAADAATTAQGGLQDASDGIKTIANALLTGQQAPVAASDQVNQGLLTAQTALNNITTTDSAVTSMVEDAKSKLEETISAGQDVISKCGGGGAANANAGSGGAEVADTSDNVNNNSGDNTSVGTGDSSDASSTDLSSTNTTDDASSSDGASTDSTETGGSDSSTTQDNTSPDTSTPAKESNNPTSLRNSRIFGKRQIGGIACNVARAQAVSRLAQSSVAVKAVKSAAFGDAATAAAADRASTALISAKGGIAKIAAALVTLQKAPAAVRDEVFNDLNDAMTALTSIDSTDPNVTSAVSAAQDRISSTIQAGNDVVSNC